MLDLNKIHELSSGVEYHLTRLEEFTELLKEVKTSLDKMQKSQEANYLWELQLLKQEFADIKTQLKKYGLPEASQYEKQFEKFKNVIYSTDWSEAIDPVAICTTEETAQQRADAILDMVVGEHLKDRRFLDYGCGEGHVAMTAKQREAAVSIGFDIDLTECKHPDLATNDFEVVKKNAPYDIILMYDVLDHIAHIDPITALNQVKSVLDKDGRVYIRNHPWSSRHGGHLYDQLNKAFLHLILDEVELTRIGGYTCKYNIGVVRPLETYQHWFDQSGFTIKSEIPLTRTVEDFFLTPSHVHSKLVEHWGDEAEMARHMEIEFVEYIVEAKSNHQIF